MPGLIHDIGVHAILRRHPELKTKQFKQALKKAVIAFGEDREMGEVRWGGVKDSIKFIPDAYSLDPKNRVVTVFEVENTNPLSDEKLGRLIQAWFVLDSISWDLLVMTCDRWGNETGLVPLMDGYYAQLTNRAAEWREAAA